MPVNIGRHLNAAMAQSRYELPSLLRPFWVNCLTAVLPLMLFREAGL
jgi:hypothetical protein